MASASTKISDNDDIPRKQCLEQINVESHQIITSNRIQKAGKVVAPFQQLSWGENKLRCLVSVQSTLTESYITHYNCVKRFEPPLNQDAVLHL